MALTHNIYALSIKSKIYIFLKLLTYVWDYFWLNLVLKRIYLYSAKIYLNKFKNESLNHFLSKLVKVEG